MKYWGGAAARVHLQVGEAALAVDLLTADQACEAVLTRTSAPWSYVITPNAQHASLLMKDPTLASCFGEAALSLPDGYPIALLASWLIREPVARAPGSDLLERILESDGDNRPILFIGGEGGEHFDRLRARCLARNWQPIREAAPRAELESPEGHRQLIGRVRQQASGGVTVVGIGAPRQELLAREICQTSGPGVVLCLGMAINFSSGAVTRAPALIQDLGLEWLYRALQEPRRLVPRYLRNAVVLGNMVGRNAHR